MRTKECGSNPETPHQQTGVSFDYNVIRGNWSGSLSMIIELELATGREESKQLKGTMTFCLMSHRVLLKAPIILLMDPGGIPSDGIKASPGET